MAPKRKPSSAPASASEYHPALLALEPGSQVEISSNDVGFRGSWYTATIVKRASSSRRNPANKFVVQYTHLFEDDAGTKPLQETINATDLRPLAPGERVRKFKFGEEVDAYHNDGWWEGVITRELDNGNFLVYFKRSKEQLEFGRDQLRLHREWVNGSWNPPLEEDDPAQQKVLTQKEVKSSEGSTEENMSNSNSIITENKSNSDKAVTEEKLEHDNTAGQKKLGTNKAETVEKMESGKITAEQIFTEGAHVEVTSDEDGFQGAWFAGTIVKAVGKDRYLIQYESLRTEDDTDFLKEEYNILQIRPSPPEIAVAGRFKKHNEVDALYNDGWWVGVISKVLPGSKYRVYFRTTKERLTFKHSDLRLHQDWIDGKWVVASQALKSS